MDESRLRKLFALRLLRALEHYGMTQSSLAKILKRTPGFINHLVSGKRLPSYRTFIELLNVFDRTPADYFFGVVDSVESNSKFRKLQYER
jgi:transcriptional regulator with XRE-family HTH domain